MLLPYLPLALAAASALAVAALVTAAATDIAHRRISNRVVLVVAFSSLALLFSLPPADAAASIGLALAVFVGGTAAFAWRLVGGGDVKLLAATALWVGTSLFSLFIVVLSLASVAIALCMLAGERWVRRTVPSGLSPETGLRAPLPLGVAIAVAGIVAILVRANLLAGA